MILHINVVTSHDAGGRYFETLGDSVHQLFPSQSMNFLHEKLLC